MGDDSILKSIQAEIFQLRNRQKCLEETIVLKQAEVQNENETHTQLRRETDTLHKRNKAQLTRLKRQLQEANSRNRRWNDEACRLEQSIAQLKRQVEK